MDPSSDAHADADSPEPESYEDEPAEEDEDDASSSAAANLVGGAATGDDEDDEDDQHNPPSVYTSQRTLQSLSHLRDISEAAVAWQVSSAKPGNGVEQLRDAATDSYWQSDGTTQPHYIQIHFHRRLAVTHVALYLDYQLDESYTPKTVRVETGMTAQDLTCTPQNQCMELNEPAGWAIFPVFGTDPGDAGANDQSFSNSASNPPRTTGKAHLLRISILSMHQNGRDTHVRRVALFAERSPLTTAAVPPPALPVKRKTTEHGAAHDSHSMDDEDDDEEDVSYMTRGLTSGFASLGMQSPFATTIR